MPNIGEMLYVVIICHWILFNQSIILIPKKSTYFISINHSFISISKLLSQFITSYCWHKSYCIIAYWFFCLLEFIKAMYLYRKSSKNLSLKKRFKVATLRNLRSFSPSTFFDGNKPIEEFSSNPSNKEEIDCDTFQDQDTSSSLKDRYASKIDQLFDTEETSKPSKSTQSGRARRRNSITKYSLSEERM